MLVLKRLSVKKLIIYISVIALTVGATGFILFKNQAVIAPGSLDDQLQTAENLNLPAVQLPEADKVISTGEIDFNMFKTEKFKALKKSDLLSQDETVRGKRDPFKSN